MKKVFALLLAAAMLLSMAACSGDSTQSTAAQTTSAQTTAAASTDSEAYSAEKFFNMAADEIVSWTPVNPETKRVGLIVSDTTTTVLLRMPRRFLRMQAMSLSPTVLTRMRPAA